MRLEGQIKMRSCRVLLRKSTLSWQIVETTKGFLIENCHGWKEGGLERKRLQARRPVRKKQKWST